MNFVDTAFDKMLSELNNQIDSVIIEGLKRKGFEFLTQNELEEFIKSNCSIEDDPVSMKKRYTVKGEVFLTHQYKAEIEFPSVGNNMTVKANLGTYSFIENV